MRRLGSARPLGLGLAGGRLLRPGDEARMSLNWPDRERGHRNMTGTQAMAPAWLAPRGSTMRRPVNLACCVVLCCVAMGVVGATSATATTAEFGKCVMVTPRTGKYGTAECTKLGGGKEDYEWQAFSPYSAGSLTVEVKNAEFEAVNGTKVTCRGGSGAANVFSEYFYFEGVIGAPRDGALTFSGCTEGKKGPACSGGPGNPAGGEITTLLTDQAYWENATASKVLMKLAPSSLGEPFATFTCGGFKRGLGGSVLVPWPHTNKMASKYSLKYDQTKGKQKYTEYEERPGGGKETAKLALSGEEAGVTMSFEVIGREKFELRVM